MSITRLIAMILPVGVLTALTVAGVFSCSRTGAPGVSTNATREPAAMSSLEAYWRRIHPDVIYGKDDRHELYAETDAGLRSVADSTVAVLKRTDVKSLGDGTAQLVGANYGTSYNLCLDEPFREQTTAAFCSGFLVAPDIVLTAGHCVTSAKDCAEAAFAFGFAYSTVGAHPEIVPESEVYGCAQVLHTQAPAKGADFAVVKLDRPVANHQPLKLRSSGAVGAGDEMTVIGYPVGLPLKIAGGAKVRDPAPTGYFVANLDTYGGNSGSAVVNSRSLEVEGILVRGERDFNYRSEGCVASNVCADDGCRGEDVTRITDVLSFLPASSAR